MTEQYEVLKLLFFSFSGGLNSSIREISNPTGDPDSSSELGYLSSKEDPLYKASDHDSSARLQPWRLTGFMLVDISV